MVNRQPVHQQQPKDVSVWWGRGLFPDRPGDAVAKPMRECSGAELLRPDRQPPAVHQGLHDPHVRVQALHTLHRT